jgi:hypothetical protein
VPGELAAGVARMVSLLSSESRADLRRLLSHELAAPTPELERAASLELLCGLVDRGEGEVPTVEEYDAERRRRKGPSPAGSTLSRRYGGWMRAVSAAAWLAAGGSGAPPASGFRDPQPPYSRAEALLALEACRDAVGEWPTAAEYEEWRRLRLRLQRRFGDGRSRMPGLSVFARIFGGIEAAIATARGGEGR